MKMFKSRQADKLDQLMRWSRLIVRARRAFPVVLFTGILVLGTTARGVAAGTLQSDQSPHSLTPLQFEIEKQRVRLVSSDPEQRRDAVDRLGALHRAEASRVAITALTDILPVVRATAALAVSSLPAEESAAVLMPLLNDLDAFVRQQVSYALGGMRNRRATAALVERLKLDKEDAVRASAAVALGQIRDEAAVVALAEVLSLRELPQAGGKKTKARDHEFLLRAAAHSLGEIRSRAGLPALIEILATDSMPGDVRREAALALGAIGDAAAIPALRAAVTASDPYLSQIATEALRRIDATHGNRS